MKSQKKPAQIFLSLLLLFVFMTSSTIGYVQPLQEQATAGTVAVNNAYTLQLFAQETVLKNPNSTTYAYVQISKGSSLAGAATLDLWYSYSPMTIPDISNMTVSVNGVPVTSKQLVADGNDRSNWQVQIPATYFKTGMNEIGVSVIHRTIDGLCRDIDNEANWFIIRPESRLNFSLARSAYTLADFPRPFLDDYVASKINTVIYLPEDYDKATLDAMMNLATGLGSHGLAASLPTRLEVRIGEPGQVAANEIVFGSNAKWHPGKDYPDDAPLLTYEQLGNGFSRLLITGDSKSFAKAVEALNRPQLTQTFLSRQVVLNSALPTAQENQVNNFHNKREMFTLLDMGYDNDIVAAGAFHQDVIMTIPRPANYSIGEGSHIELKFRHSKILDPKKSAVTVYINNIPVNSVALLPENAEGGILQAVIPSSELNESSWTVRFGFYHDLGIVDCSKRYDDVAWSVIEKETAVYLQSGSNTYSPVWENFPNDFHVGDNGQIDLSLLLSRQTTAQELTCAFKLAYYIGTNNKGRILWDVQDEDSFAASDAKGTIIALGKNDDHGQWEKLEAYLPVKLGANGNYQVDEWLEVVPDVIPAFDLYQIGKVANDKYIYAFMYKNIDGLANLLDFTMQHGNHLKGQVALVDEQGDVKAYYGKAGKMGSETDWSTSIMNTLGGTTGVYIIALLAVVAATLAIMYYTRRRS